MLFSPDLPKEKSQDSNNVSEQQESEYTESGRDSTLERDNDEEIKFEKPEVAENAEQKIEVAGDPPAKEEATLEDGKEYTSLVLITSPNKNSKFMIPLESLKYTVRY